MNMRQRKNRGYRSLWTTKRSPPPSRVFVCGWILLYNKTHISTLSHNLGPTLRARRKFGIRYK